ncbi:Protein kinase domain-containing protein ppk32 [Erysiphe necator]|nr:Protein kinase domain-containing protein ppk32 [Erysiphe necator]
MFSSALKSFSSNINSCYNISPTPTSLSGPWKIYDAKKKGSGRSVSVFVLDRRLIDAQSSPLSRSSSSSLRKVNEEVLERLKKEASILARLRHPNILELVEPVEETRNGGLQFVTEAVTHSLSVLLQKKNRWDRKKVVNKNLAHNSLEGKEKYESDKIELNEFEIQNGIEQISKALEFLHENACLVHGNLTPDAIIINSKCDWKLSGLGFSSPPDDSSKTSSMIPINLSEALNYDARLPQLVQINLDYCSPDFVLDNKINTAADMFSLGLLIVTLHNSPHESPIKANSSVTNYKRLFSSPSTFPSQNNGFLSSRPLPENLIKSVLPRLLTRWPTDRVTAKEFQQSSFFNNIPVATIRFLQSFPAKSPNEKVQFMKGLSGVISSFSEVVLEKKIITALLEEMKAPELLPLILQNIFLIIGQLKYGRKCFTEKIIPRMKEIFVAVATTKTQSEQDPHKVASLMIVLEHIRIISENCSAEEFKEYIFPIIQLAIECQVPKVVDASLRCISVFLPVLDFSTVKNELFPIIANVFAKTKSLGIKVRSLEAFSILCGGSDIPINSSDDLKGVFDTLTIVKKENPSNILDKHTMQEKIVPLIRAIKTKEPTVAVAALSVLLQVSQVADYEFVALEIFPTLWTMSLGPLLDTKQFQLFMELIKRLSNHVENEHTRKLQRLSELSHGKTILNSNSMPSITATSVSTLECSTMEFERLVKTNDNELNPFFSFFSENNNLSTLSQSTLSSTVNDFACPIPSSTNLELMTSTSKSIPLAIRSKNSYFDPLNSTSTYNIKTVPQINNFSIQTQSLSSANKGQHRTSNNSNEIVQPKIQPEINWDIALASNSKNKLNCSTQSPQVPQSNHLSDLSLIYDSLPKSKHTVLVPAQNSYTEEKGNTLTVSPGPGTNKYNILVPQKQAQIIISPLTQQQKDVKTIPPSPSSVSPQSQRMTYKNGFENWQSLI